MANGQDDSSDPPVLDAAAADPPPPSGSSRNEQMLKQLWDLRERDARTMAGLAARLEKFEAAFDAAWSVIRRLQVAAGDLAQKVEHHDAAIDACSGIGETPDISNGGDCRPDVTFDDRFTDGPA